jgi:hypothetical protein
MPLVIALKNQTTIVLASDSEGSPVSASQFGQLTTFSNRTAILVVGNIQAITQILRKLVMPKITPTLTAAGLAQLIQAALVLEVVPRLPETTGRIEVVVAGIDPVRHVEEPNLYYMDSAQDFYLKVVDTGYVAAGSTAEALPLLSGIDCQKLTTDRLKIVVKECFTTTKLRWPEVVASHLEIATITSQNTVLENY